MIDCLIYPAKTFKKAYFSRKSNAILLHCPASLYLQGSQDSDFRSGIFETF